MAGTSSQKFSSIEELYKAIITAAAIDESILKEEASSSGNEESSLNTFNNELTKLKETVEAELEGDAGKALRERKIELIDAISEIAKYKTNNSDDKIKAANAWALIIKEGKAADHSVIDPGLINLKNAHDKALEAAAGVVMEDADAFTGNDIADEAQKFNKRLSDSQINPFAAEINTKKSGIVFKSETGDRYYNILLDERLGQLGVLRIPGKDIEGDDKKEITKILRNIVKLRKKDLKEKEKEESTLDYIDKQCDSIVDILKKYTYVVDSDGKPKSDQEINDTLLNAVKNTRSTLYAIKPKGKETPKKYKARIEEHYTKAYLILIERYRRALKRFEDNNTSATEVDSFAKEFEMEATQILTGVNAAKKVVFELVEKSQTLENISIMIKNRENLLETNKNRETIAKEISEELKAATDSSSISLDVIDAISEETKSDKELLKEINEAVAEKIKQARDETDEKKLNRQRYVSKKVKVENSEEDDFNPATVNEDKKLTDENKTYIHTARIQALPRRFDNKNDEEKAIENQKVSKEDVTYVEKLRKIGDETFNTFRTRSGGNLDSFNLYLNLLKSKNRRNHKNVWQYFKAREEGKEPNDTIMHDGKEIKVKDLIGKVKIISKNPFEAKYLKYQKQNYIKVNYKNEKRYLPRTEYLALAAEMGANFRRTNCKVEGDNVSYDRIIINGGQGQRKTNTAQVKAMMIACELFGWNYENKSGVKFDIDDIKNLAELAVKHKEIAPEIYAAAREFNIDVAKDYKANLESLHAERELESGEAKTPPSRR